MLTKQIINLGDRSGRTDLLWHLASGYAFDDRDVLFISPHDVSAFRDTLPVNVVFKKGLTIVEILKQMAGRKFDAVLIDNIGDFKTPANVIMAELTKRFYHDKPLVIMATK